MTNAVVDANVDTDVKVAKPVSRWYVAYVHSGCEKVVVTRLEEKIKKFNQEAMFDEILIPTQEVTEIKQGKKVKTEKKFFPGYLLIKMIMNNETWHMVRDIPLVSGFLGTKSKALPISEKEAKELIYRLENKDEEFIADTTYEVGDKVKIIDGPFASFNGLVEKVDAEKNRVSVSVSIFGRPTIVDLEYIQVEKL